MPMKSETREEARERVVAMGEAERRGSEAAKEGILAIARTEFEDRRAEQVNAFDEQRLALEREFEMEGGQLEADVGGEAAVGGEPRQKRRGGRKAKK
jgi:hypothetical protein